MSSWCGSIWGPAAQRMEHFDILQRQLAAVAERREKFRLAIKRHS